MCQMCFKVASRVFLKKILGYFKRDRWFDDFLECFRGFFLKIYRKFKHVSNVFQKSFMMLKKA